MRRWVFALHCCALIALTGCGATGREMHYFMVQDSVTGDPVNFFRLTVSADLNNTNGRYISGYYDERAVDLFLNEIKSGDNVTRRLIDTSICADGASDAECAAAMQNRYRLVPVGGNSQCTGICAENGVFVMILSSNADAISDAIGAFANHEVILGSALHLMNKDKMEDAGRLEAAKPYKSAERIAGMDELGALLVGGENAGNAQESESYYLAALRAITRQLGIAGDIESFDDARELLTKTPQ